MKDNKGQGDSPVGKDTCCLSLMTRVGTLEPWFKREKPGAHLYSRHGCVKMGPRKRARDGQKLTAILGYVAQGQNQETSPPNKVEREN